MRQVAHMQRAKVDIKDFDPQGVELLASEGRSWVAAGKHLCGAATDFTLRCCSQSEAQGRADLLYRDEDAGTSGLANIAGTAPYLGPTQRLHAALINMGV